mmetsp:Transcript_44455/g.90723  ORF Transcript_44455/g.90723 Transcript_44455/m.90723 type:complete len:319 (+) Transcript_44455:178-1134(+)
MVCRSPDRGWLEVELASCRECLAHFVLPSLDLLLEVEEEAMDVLFGPLRAVDARKHASRGVLLSAVLEVCDLAFLDGFQALSVSLRLCCFDKVEVAVEVILKRIENVRFDLLVFLRACPQKRRREVLLRLLWEVPSPGEVFSMLRMHVKDLLARILCLVLVALEKRLHINRDEMASRKCHEIQAQERKIVIHVGKDHKVQNLQGCPAIHVGGADLSELFCLKRVALCINMALPLSLSHGCLLSHIAVGNGIRLKFNTKPFLQDFSSSLPKRPVDVRYCVTPLSSVIQMSPGVFLTHSSCCVLCLRLSAKAHCCSAQNR